MLVLTNIKMAFASLRSSRLRAALTMLGIIIGVVSVVTFISFGEGLKNQVTDEIRQFGDDFLQVAPGKLVTRDNEGNIEDFDFAAIFGATPFNEKDLKDIQELDNVATASGIMIVSGKTSANDKEAPTSSTIATTPDMITILNQEVEEGSFLDDNIKNDFTAVLGRKVATDLFGETSSAIGRTVKIKNKDFTVIGVMAQYDSILSSGAFGSDFNSFVYISFTAGKQLNNGTVQIMEIDIRVADIEKTDETIDDISATLTKNRGDDDFSITKPEEFLTITNKILGLLTTAVVAIASISVFVGGIGIMNIMFVTVSERTREIGIRKAIGATNNQILSQFLIESIVITMLGTVVGFLVSALITLLVRLTTDFSPVITPTSIIVATLASVTFGVIFGIVPAAKAARKNPIEALRHE